MRKFRGFLFYWLPVLFWMCLIFTASGDSASFKHSSRILEPLLNWLLPDLSADQRDLVVTLFRKCAHLTEYAILALLFLRARRQTPRGSRRPWLWNQAAEALWFVMFYASTDEFHQTFVPTRDGCVRDVMIDSSGAVAGLLLCWAFGRWRKIW